MASTYKILGQITPTISTNTTLYTVPSATSAVCSTLTIAPTSTSGSVNVAVVPSGETLSTQHYIMYGIACNASNALYFTIGLTLAAGDSIVVNSSSSNIAFGLFGTEVA
jgi:hypothetical protein